MIENKDKFIEVYSQNVHREGSDALLKWIQSSDFFVAPASTRYHGSYEGGLVDHSVNVYERLKELCLKYSSLGVSDETIAIVGLLHDVCKANYYVKGFRNVKNDATGKWERVDVYQVDDKFPIGHGEKSCIIVQHYMRLTPSELLAIRHHMGGFDNAVKGGDYGLIKAYDKEPLAPLLHLADMEATYLTERDWGE